MIVKPHIKLLTDVDGERFYGIENYHEFLHDTDGGVNLDDWCSMLNFADDVCLHLNLELDQIR